MAQLKQNSLAGDAELLHVARFLLPAGLSQWPVDPVKSRLLVDYQISHGKDHNALDAQTGWTYINPSKKTCYGGVPSRITTPTRTSYNGRCNIIVTIIARPIKQYSILGGLYFLFLEV